MDIPVDNFDTPEIPNQQTAKQLAGSKKQITAGDYHHFNDNQEALNFLADELSVEPPDKPLENLSGQELMQWWDSTDDHSAIFDGGYVLRRPESEPPTEIIHSSNEL